MRNKNKWSWYSTIISLLIIWFLLVLSIWIFNLVLNELNDNRAMWDYMKAFAWAESAQELALLKIKENWYSYYDKIDHDINNRSILLSNNSLDFSLFRKQKEVYISYDIWSKVNTFDGTLTSLEYDIIPLFYTNINWEQKVNSINFSIIEWASDNLSWNIIGKEYGLSWVWSSTTWVKKTLSSSQFVYSEVNINDFLNSSDSNYLILFNSWDSWDIKYSLESNNLDEYFTMPETTIESSAEVWKYKQNLSTNLNNTDFLNILRYSIYSN